MDIKGEDRAGPIREPTGFQGLPEALGPILSIGGRRVCFGTGPIIQELLRLLRAAASTQSTVLFQGPTGSGKEIYAHLLHLLSARREKRIIRLDCAKLSEGLFEDELFGHTRGAFSGADQERKGLLEEAGDGDLFLDEVGELKERMQLKLLGLLEARVFSRLGSNEVISFRARIIAATLRDLRALVDQGRFREDLYYRLNVIPIRVPALSEHREDIPALARLLLERAAAENKRPVPALPIEIVDLLVRYDWPGNIRELAHACEQAVVLGLGDLVRREDLPTAIIDGRAKKSRSKGGGQARSRKPPKSLVLSVLNRLRGNVSACAREVRRSRTQFYRLLAEYGIDRRGMFPGAGPGGA